MAPLTFFEKLYYDARRTFFKPIEYIKTVELLGSARSARTRWGSLQRSPRSPSWLKGGRFAAGEGGGRGKEKGRGVKKTEVEGRGGEGK